MYTATHSNTKKTNEVVDTNCGGGAEVSGARLCSDGKVLTGAHVNGGGEDDIWHDNPSLQVLFWSRGFLRIFS